MFNTACPSPHSSFDPFLNCQLSIVIRPIRHLSFDPFVNRQLSIVKSSVPLILPIRQPLHHDSLHTFKTKIIHDLPLYLIHSFALKWIGLQ